MDRRKIAFFLVYAGLAAHAFFVPISIAGMQIALGVAAAGLLLDPPRPLRTALDVPLAIFVGVALLSDLVSAEGFPGLAYATLWRSALGFLVVAHGLRLLPREAPFRIVACACAGLALASLVGLVQYRSGVDLVWLMRLRPHPALVEAPGVPERFGAMGFFTSRLTFGHNATILASFLLGSLAAGAIPARRIWVAAGAAVIALAAIAVTFDRAAYLGLGAAGLLVLLVARPAVRKMIAPALAILIVIGALHGGIRGRFISAFSTGSNADRVFVWSQALEIIRDHPLRGIGFGNYPRVCPRYYARSDHPDYGMFTWAHNLELTSLAEMGPIGLLAVLFLFGSAAFALWKRLGLASWALGGLAALAAFFVIAQVHDALFDTKVMYALWLALGLSLTPAWRGLQPARAE